MRIGLDIDGVLASFAPAYQQLVIRETGKNLFLPGDNENPPTWHWPQLRGYTEEQVKGVWKTILQSPDFWKTLRPLPLLNTHAQNIVHLMCDHEVYFITNRAGIRAKLQTEEWLLKHLDCTPANLPTVILAGNRMKGVIAKGLNLDVVLDDNYDNTVDVCKESPSTRVYLLTRRYNSLTDPLLEVDYAYRLFIEGQRVETFEEFLMRENLLGYTGRAVTQP